MDVRRTLLSLSQMVTTLRDAFLRTNHAFSIMRWCRTKYSVPCIFNCGLKTAGGGGLVSSVSVREHDWSLAPHKISTKSVCIYYFGKFPYNKKQYMCLVHLTSVVSRCTHTCTSPVLTDGISTSTHTDMHTIFMREIAQAHTLSVCLSPTHTSSAHACMCVYPVSEHGTCTGERREIWNTLTEQRRGCFSFYLQTHPTQTAEWVLNSQFQKLNWVGMWDEAIRQWLRSLIWHWGNNS